MKPVISTSLNLLSSSTASDGNCVKKSTSTITPATTLGVNEIFAHRLTFFNEFKNCTELYAAALKMCNIPHSVNPNTLFSSAASPVITKSTAAITNNEEILSEEEADPEEVESKKRGLKKSQSGNSRKTCEKKESIEREISLGESIERAIHKCLDSDNSLLTSPRKSIGGAGRLLLPIPSISPLNYTTSTTLSAQQAFNMLFFTNNPPRLFPNNYNNNNNNNNYNNNNLSAGLLLRDGINNNNNNAGTGSQDQNTSSNINNNNNLTTIRRDAQRAKVFHNYSESHKVAVDDHFKESLSSLKNYVLPNVTCGNGAPPLHFFHPSNYNNAQGSGFPARNTPISNYSIGSSQTSQAQQQVLNHNFNNQCYPSTISISNNNNNQEDRLRETYRNLIMPPGGKNLFPEYATQRAPQNSCYPISAGGTGNDYFTIPSNYLEASKCLYDPNFMMKYISNYLMLSSTAATTTPSFTSTTRNTFSTQFNYQPVPFRDLSNCSNSTNQKFAAKQDIFATSSPFCASSLSNNRNSFTQIMPPPSNLNNKTIAPPPSIIISTNKITAPTWSTSTTTNLNKIPLTSLFGTITTTISSSFITTPQNYISAQNSFKAVSHSSNFSSNKNHGGSQEPFQEHPPNSFQNFIDQAVQSAFQSSKMISQQNSFSDSKSYSSGVVPRTPEISSCSSNNNCKSKQNLNLISSTPSISAYKIRATNYIIPPPLQSTPALVTVHTKIKSNENETDNTFFGNGISGKRSSPNSSSSPPTTTSIEGEGQGTPKKLKLKHAWFHRYKSSQSNVECAAVCNASSTVPPNNSNNSSHEKELAEIEEYSFPYETFPKTNSNSQLPFIDNTVPSITCLNISSNKCNPININQSQYCNSSSFLTNNNNMNEKRGRGRPRKDLFPSFSNDASNNLNQSPNIYNVPATPPSFVASTSNNTYDFPANENDEEFDDPPPFLQHLSSQQPRNISDPKSASKQQNWRQHVTSSTTNPTTKSRIKMVESAVSNLLPVTLTNDIKPFLQQQPPQQPLLNKTNHQCLQALTTSNENGYETFLQKESCNNVIPKISKCLECRSVKTSPASHQGIFCRFYAFRKLKLNSKGSLTVAGFSETHEANSDDLKIWLPPSYESIFASYKQDQISRRVGDVGQERAEESTAKVSENLRNDCLYIFKNVLPHFLRLLKGEDEQFKAFFGHLKPTNNHHTAIPPSTDESDMVNSFTTTLTAASAKTTMFGPNRMAWKRAVDFVREMCDVCQTTIFNRHLVCPKCGFSACLDCFTSSKSFMDKSLPETMIDHSPWPTCSNKQAHETNKMMPTHIIPTIAINEIRQICEKLALKYSILTYEDAANTNELWKTESPFSTNMLKAKTNLSNGFSKRAFMDFSKLFFQQNINGILPKTIFTTAESSMSNSSSLQRPRSNYSAGKFSSEMKSHSMNCGDVKCKLEFNTIISSSLGVLADVALNDSTYNTTRLLSNKSSSNTNLTENTSLLQSDCVKESRNPYFKHLSPSNTLDDVITAVIEHGIAQETCPILLNPPATHLTEPGPEVIDPPKPEIKISDTNSPQLGEDFSSEQDNFPDIPHEWLSDGHVLHLKHRSTTASSVNQHLLRTRIIKLFRVAWKHSKPIIVSGIHRDLNPQLWHPKWFSEAFGDETHDLVDCRDEHKIVKNMGMNQFWDGFSSLKKREDMKTRFKFIPIVSVTSFQSDAFKNQSSQIDVNFEILNRSNPKSVIGATMDNQDDELILKLKDWPPTDDFADILPLHFKNFNEALPLPEYTYRGVYLTYDKYKKLSISDGKERDLLITQQQQDGQEQVKLNGGIFNMATRLPHLFIKPDLGPKMYIAYGSSNSCSTSHSQGTTNLHIDISDATNLLAYVGIPNTEDEITQDSEYFYDFDREIKLYNNSEIDKTHDVDFSITHDKKAKSFSRSVLRKILAAGVDEITLKRLKSLNESENSTVIPGAIWHIYDPEDAIKIRKFITEINNSKKLISTYSNEFSAVAANERQLKASCPPFRDPIHDQCTYLDDTLNDQLTQQYGVRPRVIIQCLGDAIFIPAGAPHQVKNLYSCIKIAQDFVSPEHMEQCLKLTDEFRKLPETHTNHEDKLQIKNILYHTVKDISAILNN